MNSIPSKNKFPKKFLKGAILLSISGLILSQVISPLLAYASPTLFVDISVNPSYGPAPLNNVDLTATVSGSATGNITYRFDCTNDGSWERTHTTSSTSYTATDLCSYPSAGSYTARISVEREGLVFYGTTAIFVSGGSDLLVNLYASPSSGSAPLNNVDLTATVSGSAAGDITYKFDCTSDGSWERTYTTGSTAYTAENLCNYYTAGNYTARVLVERGGLSFQGTAGIAVLGVSGENASLSVEKLARNITQGQTTFSKTISAKPGDILGFSIRVTSTGDRDAENVIVTDNLPNKIIFQGNVKIDGNPITGSPNISSGIGLGNLAPGQTKTLTFEGRVATEENFGYGITSLINTGIGRANNVSAVANNSWVNVSRTAVAGAATEVSTGAMDYLYFSVIAVFILSLCIYALLQMLESSQNKLARRFVRRYYMFKVFVAPRQR